MNRFKDFCQKNGFDESRVVEVVISGTNDVLRTATGFTGYLVYVGDDSLTFYNDKFDEKKEIPYASFQDAEFGIGSGQLWLQCIIDGSPLDFCAMTKMWKSPAALLMIKNLQKFVSFPGTEDREYKQATGKFSVFFKLIR